MGHAQPYKKLGERLSLACGTNTAATRDLGTASDSQHAFHLVEQAYK
jgi:hypothetical protein